jgi:flagellar biogenesis protein FliO
MLARVATCLLIGLVMAQCVSLVNAQELAGASPYRLRHETYQGRDDSPVRRTTEDLEPATQILPVETLVIGGSPSVELSPFPEERSAESNHSSRRSSASVASSTEWQTSESQTSELQTSELQTSESQTSELPTADLPLPPRRRDRRDAAAGDSSVMRSPIWTVASSLTMVVGLFLLTVWGARKHLPQAATPLPEDVVRVLGRAPLAHRQTMQLVRIGNKLVLLCVTPQGAETLAEIHDPDEVSRLTSSCDPSSPDVMSETFRHILSEVRDSRFSTSAAEDEQRLQSSLVRRHGG